MDKQEYFSMNKVLLRVVAIFVVILLVTLYYNNEGDFNYLVINYLRNLTYAILFASCVLSLVYVALNLMNKKIESKTIIISIVLFLLSVGLFTILVTVEIQLSKNIYESITTYLTDTDNYNKHHLDDIRNIVTYKEVYSTFSTSYLRDFYIEWKEVTPLLSLSFLSIIYIIFISIPIVILIVIKTKLRNKKISS